MKFLSRPGFYAILLLIALMLLLTLWLQWKIDSLPKRKAKQEAAPVLKQPLLLEVHDGQDR